MFGIWTEHALFRSHEALFRAPGAHDNGPIVVRFDYGAGQPKWRLAFGDRPKWLTQRSSVRRPDRHGTEVEAEDPRNRSAWQFSLKMSREKSTAGIDPEVLPHRVIMAFATSVSLGSSLDQRFFR